MVADEHDGVGRRVCGVDRRTVWAGAVAGVGGGLAVGIMEWFWVVTQFPLAAIPFTTSIVLVLGGPEAKTAEPRALVGGHVISTVIGLVVVDVCGPHVCCAAPAVGSAILTMYVTDTFHLPAGIDPLLGVTRNIGWSYLLLPVLGGALMLLLFAYAWHRWVRRKPWPLRWW